MMVWSWVCSLCSAPGDHNNSCGVGLGSMSSSIIHWGAVRLLASGLKFLILKWNFLTRHVFKIKEVQIFNSIFKRKIETTLNNIVEEIRRDNRKSCGLAYWRGKMLIINTVCADVHTVSQTRTPCLAGDSTNPARHGWQI